MLSSTKLLPWLARHIFQVCKLGRLCVRNGRRFGRLARLERPHDLCRAPSRILEPLRNRRVSSGLVPVVPVRQRLQAQRRRKEGLSRFPVHSKGERTGRGHASANAETTRTAPLCWFNSYPIAVKTLLHPSANAAKRGASQRRRIEKRGDNGQTMDSGGRWCGALCAHLCCCACARPTQGVAHLVRVPALSSLSACKKALKANAVMCALSRASSSSPPICAFSPSS